VTHPNEPVPSACFSPIRIAAAVIADAKGRILLVRKRSSFFFMQPGGKREGGETALEALARELHEELGCTLLQTKFLGIFRAPAANEPAHTVEADLYLAEISGEVKPGAEIDEVAWIEPRQTNNLPLAPLTQYQIFPFVLSLPLCSTPDRTRQDRLHGSPVQEIIPT
jgi:8-oxo-dGTP diphosphatase